MTHNKKEDRISKLEKEIEELKRERDASEPAVVLSKEYSQAFNRMQTNYEQIARHSMEAWREYVKPILKEQERFINDSFKNDEFIGSNLATLMKSNVRRIQTTLNQSTPYAYPWGREDKANEYAVFLNKLMEAVEYAPGLSNPQTHQLRGYYKSMYDLWLKHLPLDSNK